MYKAIVVKLTNFRPIEGADRIQLADALGCQIIVGIDADKEELKVLFPVEGALSLEMCMNNDLYRKHPETGEAAGGYLDNNGRIRTLKLRGQNSEGLVMPLSSLEWTGHNISKLKEGDEFDTLNKQKVCEKYINRATRTAMDRKAKQYKRPWWVPKFLAPMHKKYVVNAVKFDPCPTFEKHFSTGKLRLNLHNIPDDCDVYVSSKKHGTSGRTGLVPYRSKNWFKRFIRAKGSYQYVTGTRNVTKPPNFHKKKEDGYYGGTDFRGEIHKNLMTCNLHKDEIIYYEILGWAGAETKIMPDHTINKKDFKDAGYSSKEVDKLIEKYDGKFTYTYGCPKGECRIEVYRITQNGQDIPWLAVEARCNELGLKFVDQLAMLCVDDDLMTLSKELSEQEDSDGQLREGVCLRFEDRDRRLQKVFKFKSFNFCVAEQILANSEYVDMETIS